MNLLLVLLFACSSPAPEATPEAAPAARADAAARVVAIEVSGYGYAPAEVEAKAGESLTLQFHRADANNCGDVVVFPSLDKRVDLPVGETVPVTITVPNDGTLAFTCGMAMYEGAIVVAGG